MPARRSRRPRRLGAALAVPALVPALVLALVLGAAAPAAGAGAAPRPAAEEPGPRVLLVGVPGLRWDDVDRSTTPALHALAQDGALAAVATRSVRRVVCPADGWLAVSAGRRAADAVREAGGPLCRRLEPPEVADGVASVPRWPAYRQAQEDATTDYGARLGLLGDTLAAAGAPAAAVGPGAAIALATGDGRLAGGYRPAGGPPRALADAVGAAFADGARLVVVDAGALRDPAELPEAEEGAALDPEARSAAAAADDPARSAPPRAVQAAALDARAGAAAGAAPPGATVVVVSLADSGDAQHLTLAVARGPAPGGGQYAEALLRTSSTRQDGVVQATDVTPTLLALLGLEQPEAVVGAPFRPLPGSPATTRERLEAVLDTDAANQAVRPVIPPFFSTLVALQLLLYGGATALLRRRSPSVRRRRRVLAGLQRTAVLFACVPVATFLANLVPWWRSPAPTLLLVALVVALAAAVAALALAPPWGRRPVGPLGVVGGLTAVVLAVDVTTGGRLGTSSLMGLQPIVAGRFYGFGNTQFALFATGSLLAALAVADPLVRAGRPRAAAAAVAVVGAAAVVVDGTPGWGSDVGGPPAIVPAMALLALAAAGVRLTARRLLAVAGATAAVVLGLALGDHARPPGERTHLGRFVQTVLDGGALPVLERKVRTNLRVLLVPLNLVVPFAAAFVALVLMRPGPWGEPALHRASARVPLLRAGTTSLLVLLGIGTLVNDSGVSIIAVGATLAVPLVTALSARVLDLELDAGRGDRPGGAPEPAALSGARG